MTAPFRLFGASLAAPLVAAALAVACIATAQADPATIQLEPGQQKTWTQGRAIKRAATADDGIVGINVAAPNGVILTAKKPGSAMVSVWESGSKGAPAAQFRVEVLPAGLKNGPKDSDVQLGSEGTKLRLSGKFASLEKHAAVEASVAETADKAPNNLIDQSTSKFDVQVQIDVKIVEVSRSKLMASGFFMSSLRDGRFKGISGPNNLSALETVDGANTVFSSTGFVPRADAFNLFSWGKNTLTVFSALEANGFAYTLAEPSLTALSGQTASFLAGGELPIPFRSGSGGDSSVTVQFKEFGIRLGLAPTVLDQDRIALKISPEVSEIDPSLSVQAGGFDIPGLRVRRTETTVALGDGETFVISGLISRQSTANIDKFPVLGDIPVLGAFFRSNRIEREDKELLMIVTPRLVRPFSREARLPELPGEGLRQYDPGYLHLLLLENGQFDRGDAGFSR
ncbi:MAG: type II and III secretion system protein family protein [Burkholderiales bacterium]|nr:type II and III secretion system protein family protein [Burkholderiales bacterium]MBH2015246.1 type II and III secretion system protein family protein [Burkholderiales bacterium]